MRDWGYFVKPNIVPTPNEVPLYHIFKTLYKIFLIIIFEFTKRVENFSSCTRRNMVESNKIQVSYAMFIY